MFFQTEVGALLRGVRCFESVALSAPASGRVDPNPVKTFASVRKSRRSLFCVHSCYCRWRASVPPPNYRFMHAHEAPKPATSLSKQFFFVLSSPQYSRNAPPQAVNGPVLLPALPDAAAMGAVQTEGGARSAAWRLRPVPPQRLRQDSLARVLSRSGYQPGE